MGKEKGSLLTCSCQPKGDRVGLLQQMLSTQMKSILIKVSKSCLNYSDIQSTLEKTENSCIALVFVSALLSVFLNEGKRW